ncbi:MAG: hypothetical protein PHQ23_15875 [Candidatus Wallbacteria bacterium]|nr:hypothetical protein [Candidatus Wallbacteria bacterium]
MKLSNSVNFGARILVAMNLLMAFGSIWVFVRMTPAIEMISERNEKSLYACEEMLESLAGLPADKGEADRRKLMFEAALKKARSNVSESEEPEALETISRHFHSAFEGDWSAKEKTVSGISHLSRINRKAMAEANRKAKQLGYAGAWGVVFMAAGVFLTGLIFMRGLRKTLVSPLEEISSVLTAYAGGDTLRRCSGANMSPGIRSVYNSLNDLLDNLSSHHQTEKQKNY